MKIREFALQAWENGDDEDTAAKEFLSVALDSEDPFAEIFPVVRAVMSEQYRQIRLAQLKTTDRALDDDPAHTGHESQESHGQDTPSLRRLLAEQEVLVVREGKFVKICWQELLLTDITPTVLSEERIIRGHKRRISRLRQARRLMEQHRVTRLGDVPGFSEERFLSGEEPDDE